MTDRGAPLTLGSAGHVDHGKTALVLALTGVDTDRLPQEKARGMSIGLGYAPLRLPGGRDISIVDVPGHERFVRTMVAGATGVDFFLMAVAADDGVMPQTREHAAVLAALGIERGVVAITKRDRADPQRAAVEAAELLPDVEIVPCSARTGEGVAAVAAALHRVAERLPARAGAGRGAVLHVDRAFTIRGAGTVVTGTLWSGVIARGDALALLPAGRVVRVRSVQVHDESVSHAQCGQRVALNLAGLSLRDVTRGDALADPELALGPTLIIDAALTLRDARHGQRVMVHHGTRSAPARLVELGASLWQLRLEAPLLAAASDRLVVRSVAPPDTLGGGTVLDPRARRHGRRAELMERLERMRRGEPDANGPAARTEPQPQPQPQHAASPPSPSPSPAELELAARLLAAGHEPPSRSELGAAAAELPALLDAGLAVRVGRDMYAHRAAVAAIADRVAAIIQTDGTVTLARLRDELDTSRRYAQALLEHLDAARVTRRLPDDRRVLRRGVRQDR